jgi:hypothetical protein
LVPGRSRSSPETYLQLYLAYPAALSAGEHTTGRAVLDQVQKDGAGHHQSYTAELDGFASSVASYVATLGMSPSRRTTAAPSGLISQFGILNAVYGNIAIDLSRWASVIAERPTRAASVAR